MKAGAVMSYLMFHTSVSLFSFFFLLNKNVYMYILKVNPVVNVRHAPQPSCSVYILWMTGEMAKLIFSYAAQALDLWSSYLCK